MEKYQLFSQTDFDDFSEILDLDSDIYKKEASEANQECTKNYINHIENFISHANSEISKLRMTNLILEKQIENLNEAKNLKLKFNITQPKSIDRFSTYDKILDLLQYVLDKHEYESKMDVERELFDKFQNQTNNAIQQSYLISLEEIKNFLEEMESNSQNSIEKIKTSLQQL